VLCAVRVTAVELFVIIAAPQRWLSTSISSASLENHFGELTCSGKPDVIVSCCAIIPSHWQREHHPIVQFFEVANCVIGAPPKCHWRVARKSNQILISDWTYFHYYASQPTPTNEPLAGVNLGKRASFISLSSVPPKRRRPRKAQTSPLHPTLHGGPSFSPTSPQQDHTMMMKLPYPEDRIERFDFDLDELTPTQCHEVLGLLKLNTEGSVTQQYIRLSQALELKEKAQEFDLSHLKTVRAWVQKEDRALATFVRHLSIDPKGKKAEEMDDVGTVHAQALQEVMCVCKRLGAWRNRLNFIQTKKDVFKLLSDIRNVFISLRPEDKQNPNEINNIERECCMKLGFTRSQLQAEDRLKLKSILADEQGKYKKWRGTLWIDEYEKNENYMRENMNLLLDVLIEKEAQRRKEEESRRAELKELIKLPEKLYDLTFKQIKELAKDLKFDKWDSLYKEGGMVRNCESLYSFLENTIYRAKEDWERVMYTIDDLHNLITSEGIQYITVKAANTNFSVGSNDPTAENKGNDDLSPIVICSYDRCKVQGYRCQVREIGLRLDGKYEVFKREEDGEQRQLIDEDDEDETGGSIFRHFATSELLWWESTESLKRPNAKYLCEIMESLQQQVFSRTLSSK